MPQVSFKTKLKPNNKQATLLAKHAGTARHAWNWGLSLCLKVLDNKEKLPTAIDLHKRLFAEVNFVNHWYDQVSPCSPQQALRHLATAFKQWLVSKVSQKPTFKKKGITDSFYLEGGIKISGNRIKLPRIGWITCHEIPPSVTVKNVTISKLAQDWYISFSYEKDIQPTAKIRDRISVDVGINRLSTCSDETEVENVKAYRNAKGRLVRLQRTLSRKVKGSSNRQKAINRLAKQHQRVANIRADALHKLTTGLAKNHSTIVIEDLPGSGRHNNHRLASAIADCGCSEFKRQLLYKASWYGAEVIIADRFYPSSQLCSECSHQQQMPLHIRTFSGSCCGMKKDQAFNASVNLENSIPAVSSTVVACGDSQVTASGQ